MSGKLSSANSGHGDADQGYGYDREGVKSPMMVLSAAGGHQGRRQWHEQYLSVPIEHQGFGLICLQFSSGLRSLKLM